MSETQLKLDLDQNFRGGIPSHSQRLLLLSQTLSHIYHHTMYALALYPSDLWGHNRHS